MRSFCCVSWTIVTVILGGWSGVWAQAPTQIEVERLMAADAAAGDLFGYSLDLSSDGNTALIGAYGDNHAGGFDAGAAYVFVRDSNGDWSLPAAAIKLVAADAALNNWFGWAVALSGDGETAVVGAHRNIHAGGFEAGAAYVFERSLAGGWDQVAKLTASDALMGDRFGWSVDVSDDGRRVLVGAYNDDHSGINDAGSAYVFARDASDTWAAPVEEARLFAADAAATDWFGHDVALSGDGQTALVGSMLDNHSGTGDGGSAYVFTRSALGVWTSAASATRLIASDVASGDRFGVSVCLSFSGDKAMVGAYLADIATDSAAGAAYLFERDGAGTWGPSIKLTAFDASPTQRFGWSVDLSADGHTALVGAHADASVGSGSAYLFHCDAAGTWQNPLVVRKLVSSGLSSADGFSAAVAVSGDGLTGMIGAHVDDHSSLFNAGSTYIYDLPPRVTPPTIILDPMTHTVCLGGQTSLVADASGTSPNWQWHYSPDGVVPFLPLVDGPGGPGNAQVSGSQTARLRMADLTVGGHFQAVATNLGGTAVSAPAELTLDTIFKPGSSTVNTVATDISDLLLTDLDGDGDRDIVVANRSGNPDLLVFHNDGLGNFGSSIDLSLGTGCSASSICVADLGTAGGRAILVACPGTQSIELLDTSSLALLPSRAVPGGGEVVSLQCCDLEGVGISDDLLTVSLDPTTGNFQVQQHPGGVLSGGALYAHLQLLDARCNDLDQDGWLDTVVARSDSFVSLIRGQAGSPVPAGDLDLSSFGSVVIPNLLRCQDLTGDAFPEIVVGIAASPAWPEGGVVIFVHDGLPGPINPSHYLISGPHVGFALPEDVAVGDLFGDSVPGFVGHYDLVLASSDDVAQFTALETSGVFSAEVHCGSDQIKLVRLGDLNGDATLDQVIAHTDGRLTVSCSTNRPVAQAYGSSCTGSNGSPQISGTPAVVNAVQAILLNGGRSNSAAILGVSTNPVMNELGPGCTIYLGAPVLTFSRTTNAIGQSSFGYLVPPGTEGVELYFQWIIFDPNGALNGVLAMSDALKVKIGS